jgi:hypothetical protein
MTHPSNWSQDVSDRLLTIARKTVENARKSPGEWHNPISAFNSEVLYHQAGGYYEISNHPRYGSGTLKRSDPEDAARTLKDAWSQALYDKTVPDAYFIVQKEIFGPLGDADTF